jgi:hypothetical protein
MRSATKVELVLFSLLAMAMLGCGVAERAPKDVKPITLRNLACVKVADGLADCKCNAPVFAFNAKTGEQEIQCAGATK